MATEFLDAQIARVSALVETALAEQKAVPFDQALASARREQYDAARTARQQRYQELLQTYAELAARRGALADALTAGSPTDLPALEQAVADAVAAVGSARQQLSQADSELLDRHRSLVEAYGTAGAIGQLGRGVPVMMLPVRIETRYFARDAVHYELRVRIFPDALHIDDHQPLMTSIEHEAGQRYWRARLDDGPESDAALAAWHALCELSGEPRAGWIVARLDPYQADGRQQTGSGAPPPLPQPPLAPDGWADPAHARLLPDRWAVVGYHGDSRLLLHWSAPVPPKLQVSPTPGLPGEELIETDANGLEAGIEWLADFAAAEARGMAVRIPVEKTIARHMDRLCVFGVRATLPAADGSDELGEVLEHQAATSLGFVPAGTPTNNTELARSGYRERPKQHGDRHRELLTRAPGVSYSDRADGRLAAALDVDAAIFRRTPGADADTEHPARAMQRVLWYATWDPLLRHQLEVDMTEEEIRFVRDHFLRDVRARGPLPLLRVQSQPYGVLPVVPLERWRPQNPSVQQTILVNILRSLAGDALRRVRLRHMPTSRDPQEDLLHILAMSPQAFVEQVITKTFPTLTEARESRNRTKPWWDAVIPKLKTGPITTSEQHGNLELWVRMLGRTGKVYDTSRPLVANQDDKRLPMPGSVNYLAHLASRPSLTAVRNHQISGASARALLYMLLREAYESVPTFTLELHTLFYNALAELKDLPVEQLEALATDVIDLCWHRIDAWVTSVASMRLREVRTGSNIHGIHIGGYGWVENLVPPGEGVVDDGAVREDPDSAGYLHLPSPQQARTAAMLYGAYLSRGESGSDAELDIDLSSDRVRSARQLLSGMRQGQPLGALLGYRIERMLVDRKLGAHIPTLRLIAPLAVGPTDPAEAERERDPHDPATTSVVDGLVLIYLRKEGLLGNKLRAHGVARNAELGILGVTTDAVNMLDALSDLLLAEGVHHAAGGNPDRAAAAFDAMAEGAGSVPAPDVVTTPAGGQQTGQRLLVALPAQAPGWPGDAARPRAVAEPRLNAWAAAMLGAPDAIGFTAVFTPADGSAATERGYTLAEFDLCPLDSVYLSAATARSAPLVLLIQHYLRAVGPDGNGFVGEVAIDVGRTDTARSLEESLALAHGLHRVLAAARPLQVDDATLSGGGSAGDQAELASRAAQVQTALQTLQSTLEADPANPNNWWPAAVLLGPADPREPATIPALRAGIGARLSEHDAAAEPTARIAALLGRGFSLLPLLNLPNGAVLAAGLDDQDRLLDGDRTRPRRWLHDHARVRPGAEALDSLLSLADVLGAPDSLTVTQLPSRGGESWIGDRMASAATARLSLAVHAPLPVDYSQPLAGLLVDSWTDVIPRSTTTTGLAFNYDAPKAQAPQCALLALPPDLNRNWQFEDLEAVLAETLHMARARLVNITSAAGVGDYLPGLYIRGDVESDLAS